MATASVECGMLWTDMEGRDFPGGWRLRRLLRPEGRNAWFEATGPDGKPAIVSLTETLNDEDEMLARLRAAAEVRHPNVVAVRDARLVWMSGTPVVMAAMESTDENLAEVLRNRALDPSEARLLLNSLLQGLAAIHARGLTHGRMETGSVLAIGDTVKLRSDCLHLEGFESGAPEDVRGVGRIVMQALTRRIPSGENGAVPQLLPEPMQRALRRALSGNATVEEVAALAGTRLTKATEAEPPRTPEAWRVAASMVSAIRRHEEPDRNAGEPDSAAERRPAAVTVMRAAEASSDGKAAVGQMDLPLIPRFKNDSDEEDEDEAGNDDDLTTRFIIRVNELRGRFAEGVRGLPGKWNYHRRGAGWVIGAAVGLSLATALMLHGWLNPEHKARIAGASPRVMVERAVPVRGAASAIAQTSAPRVWRVVVDTYHSRNDAAQRARDLGHRYPQLRPRVMGVRGGDFLVTLGGAMSREDAIALRARAVGMGLPRDTYAQNFRHAGNSLH